MRQVPTVCTATNETYDLVHGCIMRPIVIGSSGTVLNILPAYLIRAEGSLKNRRKTVLSAALSHLRHRRSLFGSILSIGFPFAIQYALTEAAPNAITKFAASFDTAAAAGFGIAKKKDQLPLFYRRGQRSASVL